ncbi:MAG TPA: PH domain-containing protein [Methanoregulaceae archaeon]|nr:PH domain-containing protein [Methanoregulaceae archaeon]
MTADNHGTGGRGVTIYPSPRLRSLYNIYLLVIVWCFVIPGLLILIVFIDPLTRIFISIIALILALIAIAVIRKSCESLAYTFYEDALEVRKGPWSGRRLLIPYGRISGAEVIRRRLPSYLGIASVRIIYTTTSGETARIYLNGIENPEGLQSRILSRTGGEPG